MIWENLGWLYKPESNFDWMISHASLPTIIQTDCHNFKIFYSTRDTLGKSHTTFVDLNFKNWKPGVLLKNINQFPSFSPNSPGYFDDSGVSLTSFVKIENILYAYYLGWSKKIGVPFSNEIGIAIVDNNFNFKRIQKLPIYNKSEVEPLTFGYPTIVGTNKKIYMYYDSIDKWDESEPNNYKFDLRVAVMKGSHKWLYCNKLSLVTNIISRAITRPAFISTPTGLMMVYSCEIDGEYKLNAALQDKKNHYKWIKNDRFIFPPSGQSWDSNEQSYCNIFKYQKYYYMLYNGNKYGKTGFGIAKLISF